MEAIFSKVASLFGYKLLEAHQFDKLYYAAHHKPQEKVISKYSALDFKARYLDAVSCPVIVDVGAYVGKTVTEYINRFPKSIIYAIEPSPASFKKLCNEFVGVESVRCLNLALSDSTGTKQFILNNFSPTNSLLSKDPAADESWGQGLLDGNETVSVKTITLDELSAQYNIKEINLLKLDVQGAEAQVLDGAARLLKEKQIGMVYLEALFAPTYIGQSSLSNLMYSLESNGYRLIGIFNLTYSDTLKQADLLFCREK